MRKQGSSSKKTDTPMNQEEAAKGGGSAVKLPTKAVELLDKMAKTLEEPWSRVESRFSKAQWERMTDESLATAFEGADKSIQKLQMELGIIERGRNTNEMNSEAFKLKKELEDCVGDIQNVDEQINYLWEDFKLYENDRSNTRKDIQERKMQVQKKEADLRGVLSQLKTSMSAMEKKLEHHYRSLMAPIGEQQLENLRKIRNDSKVFFEELRMKPDTWFSEKAWEKQMKTPSGAEIVDWGSMSTLQSRRGSDETVTSGGTNK